MNRVSFNDGWRYRHADYEDNFKEITLPHDAMLSEPRTPESAGGTNTGFFEGHD